MNFYNKNSDAISFSLIFSLILGDLFSMMSGIYKNINSIIIFSSLYHIFLDLIVIVQIIYYRKRSLNESIYLIEDYSRISKRYYFYLTSMEFIFVLIGGLLLITSQILLECKINIADFIGWIATIIFILSRVPQIILNYNRNSTEGLSIFSFIIINLANFFFCMSIVIVLVDVPKNNYLDYLMYNIQWIIGSICTMIFDVIILYQFIKYYKKFPLAVINGTSDDIFEIEEVAI